MHQIVAHERAMAEIHEAPGQIVENGLDKINRALNSSKRSLQDELTKLSKVNEPIYRLRVQDHRIYVVQHRGVGVAVLGVEKRASAYQSEVLSTIEDRAEEFDPSVLAKGEA